MELFESLGLASNTFFSPPPPPPSWVGSQLHCAVHPRDAEDQRNERDGGRASMAMNFWCNRHNRSFGGTATSLSQKWHFSSDHQLTTVLYKVFRTNRQFQSVLYYFWNSESYLSDGDFIWYNYFQGLRVIKLVFKPNIDRGINSATVCDHLSVWRASSRTSHHSTQKPLLKLTSYRWYPWSLHDSVAWGREEIKISAKTSAVNVLMQLITIFNLRLHNTILELKAKLGKFGTDTCQHWCFKTGVFF